MQDLSRKIIDYLVPLTREDLLTLINVKGNIAAFVFQALIMNKTRYSVANTPFRLVYFYIERLYSFSVGPTFQDGNNLYLL